jgi:hypothetical protein
MPKKSSKSAGSRPYPAGLRIVDLALLDGNELGASAWHRSPVVLVLGDGSTLYPSRDDEGNDAGTLVVVAPRGGRCLLAPQPPGASPGLLPRELVGREISSAGYQGLGYRHRPLVLVLDDGTALVPQSDPEGNDAGAWFGTHQGRYFTIPVER